VSSRGHYDGTEPYRIRSSWLRIKQLFATLHLRVRPILDLVPDRTRRVGVGLPFPDNTLEVEALRCGEEVSAAAFDREHAREDRARCGDEPLKRTAPARERQPAQIPPIEPEDVEGGVVEVSTAREKAAEVLPRPSGSSATTSPSRMTSAEYRSLYSYTLERWRRKLKAF
jgi:hypothetical protein